MGYRITPDDNTPSFINSGDIRANEGMLTIQLRTEEPLSFDLEIRSIDLAGNVSTGHSVARVSDPGSAGGCAIQRGTGSTPRRAGLTPVVALIAAVLAGLRRRRYDAPSA
jgi:hypothetical protein